jgi:hyperosmotically inducible protein
VITKRRNVKLSLLYSTLLAVLAVGTLGGCSNEPAKSPDVTDAVRTSLDHAGLKDVSVSDDRDKGVITLTGTTTSDADKAEAESIAKSIAGSQVVADQVAVRPPGAESTAKQVDSDLDKAIEKNLDAALLQIQLKKDISFDVENGVVTLKGTVNSQSRRSRVESVAAGVPNVKEVVNELQVKNQKATSMP